MEFFARWPFFLREMLALLYEFKCSKLMMSLCK